jgi:hypothetical protein
MCVDADATHPGGLSGSKPLETNPLSCSSPSPNPPARVRVIRRFSFETSFLLRRLACLLFGLRSPVQPLSMLFRDPHLLMVTWDDDCQSEIARGRSPIICCEATLLLQTCSQRRCAFCHDASKRRVTRWLQEQICPPACGCPKSFFAVSSTFILTTGERLATNYR